MLEESLQSLISWVSANPHWIGLLLFLVSFLESLALVGFVVPGAVLLFASGALVATGAYPLWDALLWTILGAIVGDGLSYWLGRHYQYQLRNLWPLSRHPELIERGEQFFHRHGGKSVALGRFVGPIRAVVPAVAGILGMSPLRFYLINILSAILWAPAYILPGVLFGASLSLAAEVAGRLVLLMLILAAVVLFGVWLVRWFYRHLQPHTAVWLQDAHQWLIRHPRIGPLMAGIIDPHISAFKGLLIWALLLLFAVAGFVALLFTLQQGQLLPGDQLLWQLLQGLRSEGVDSWLVAITHLGDGRVSVTLFVMLSAWLWWQGQRSSAYYLLATLLFVVTVPVGLKLGLQLPRPLDHGDGWSSYGFPSWHAVTACCLYGMLAVMVARVLPGNRHWLAYGLAAVPILLISFSRLYLGVHWLSDVLGGLALGLGWLAIVGVAYRRHVSVSPPWQSILMVVLVAWVVIWPANVMNSDNGQYQNRLPLPQLSESQWLAYELEPLAEQRSDTLGMEAPSLNLLWRGPADDLKREMAMKGWQPALRVDWRAPLLWLAEPEKVEQPIPLPQQHLGQFDDLRWVMPRQGMWLVLRLWHVADVEGLPLWQGYASTIHYHSLFEMIYLPYSGTPLSAGQLQPLLPFGEVDDTRLLIDSGD